MDVVRDRSYGDLSPQERKTYDELRRQQRQASVTVERDRIKAKADAMLGLRVVDLSRFEGETGAKAEARRADREADAQGRRAAGTSRDPGHWT